MEPLFASIGVAVFVIGALYPAVRILVVGLERTLKRLSKGALGSTRRGHQVELTWEEDRYQRTLGGNARSAANKIRERIGEVAQGALALVQATGGGELSVASEAGALELVEDPGADEG